MRLPGLFKTRRVPFHPPADLAVSRLDLLDGVGRTVVPRVLGVHESTEPPTREHVIREGRAQLSGPSAIAHVGRHVDTERTAS